METIDILSIKKSIADHNQFYNTKIDLTKNFALSNKIISDFHFYECNLSSSFLAKAVIRNCIFQRIDFSYSYLRKLKIEDSMFVDCIFYGCWFSNSIINNCYFYKSCLSKPELEPKEMSNVFFDKCSLPGFYFWEDTKIDGLEFFDCTSLPRMFKNHDFKVISDLQELKYSELYLKFNPALTRVLNLQNCESNVDLLINSIGIKELPNRTFI